MLKVRFTFLQQIFESGLYLQSTLFNNLQNCLKPIFIILYSQLYVTRLSIFNSLRNINTKNKRSKLLGTYSGGSSPEASNKRKKIPLSLINCGLRARFKAIKFGIMLNICRVRLWSRDERS